MRAIYEPKGKEPLDAITLEDVIKEGFPLMSPDQFVKCFAKNTK